MTSVARDRSGALDAQAALESWLRVSQALVEDQELGEVLDVIAEVARDLTGHPYAMVAMADGPSDRLVVRGSAGLPPEYLTFTNVESPLIVGDAAGTSETPSARAFRTGEPVKLPDLFTDQAFAGWRDAAHRQGFRSVLSLPLAGPGELGALTVYGEAAGEFDAAQVDLLAALAQGAAAAIEIARLRRREAAVVAELEAVDRMHQRLNHVALANRGLGPILHSLSDMTGYAMLIEEYPGKGVVAAWPEHHTGPQLPPNQRRALRERASAAASTASWSTADHTVVVAPVAPAGEVAALLWASGGAAPMTETQRRVFERGAMVASFELLKQRHAHDVESRLRGDLLRDLLNLEQPGEGRILERARSYALDLTEPHAVVIVGSDGGRDDADASPTSEAALQHVIACARAIAAGLSGGTLVAAHAGQVVMLLPAGADHEPAERTARRVASLVASRAEGRFSASAAVGEVCNAPLDYRAAAQVASTALRIGQDTGERGAVIDVAGLGVFRLLLSGHEPGELLAFARRTLGPLRGNQDARNADLVETLQTYLHHDMQAGRTAKILHVHPNTLAYRLRRIEALTGLSLRSTQGLLDVSFALAINRIAPER